jgi:putative tricarboxylic transport membrane protein
VLLIAAQIHVWQRKPKVVAGERPIEAEIPTSRYSELAG